jgi:hypothetical protein
MVLLLGLGVGLDVPLVFLSPFAFFCNFWLPPYRKRQTKEKVMVRNVSNRKIAREMNNGANATQKLPYLP